MKKFILSITLLLFTINSFSQVEKAPRLSRDYYLQKSKNKKTTAWILLAGGTAMIVGGAIFYPKREPPVAYTSLATINSSLSDAFTLNANDIIIMIGTAADII